jgi:CubicO group peptidase (beta-lactamase class C family)
MAHDARTKHDLQSITKSVTALLVGIAIDLGKLKTLDAPMSRFFLPIPTFAQRRSCASPCGIC